MFIFIPIMFTQNKVIQEMYYLNRARQIHTTKPRVSPTMGMSMAGLRPLVSDHGPTKRQTIMPGMEERMDWYIVIVATSFWTSICSA